MNVLSIVEETAAVVGTDIPKTLFDKNDAQSVLFLSLLNDTLESLKRFGDWQQLQKEGSFFIFDNQSVYPLSRIADDFFSLTEDTIYIKDAKEKIIGSVSPEAFMYQKIFETPGHETSFTIKSNAFYFLKLPSVGSKVEFQYRSRFVIKEKEQENGEFVFKERPTKDTDIPLFDPYLVKLSLIWRWYKRNALPYEEEYQEYLSEVKKAYSEGQSLKNISLVGSDVFLNSLGGVHVSYVPKTKG